ncbi:hypothetical protein GEMRC1_003019 [Eukaryota sp. GEM-RC1]
MILILSVFLISTLALSDVGSFWTLNDVHYSQHYRQGSNPNTACTKGHGSAGKFGHLQCCAPKPLLDSALDFMASIEPNPDFVSFLGDLIPQSETLKESVFKKANIKPFIQSFTDLVHNAFPNSRFVPVLGNHDILPAFQFSPLNRYIYKDSLEAWKHYIPQKYVEDYLHGGYYRVDLTPSLSLLVLNTNLYFTCNIESLISKDPEGQFQWIENQMNNIIAEDRNVLVISHVPVGIMESTGIGEHGAIPNMWPQFNHRLLKSLQPGVDSGRVKALFAGHEHSDAMRLLWNEKENGPGSVMFISPSLTYSENSFYGGSNPGVRLYRFNRTTGTILDFEQYYLNVSAANESEVAEWKLEYSARDAYKEKDMSAASSYRIWKKLTVDSEMMAQYVKMNTVGLGQVKIDHNVVVRHLCSYRYAHLLEFYTCKI